MKKTVLSLILMPILVLSLSSGAHAYAGSAEDPLISKSFAESWAEALLNDLLEQAQALIQGFEQQHPADTPAEKRYELAEGSTVRLYEGASITLTSGTAKVSIDKGEFVNVTVGGAAINGRLLPGHLYIVCEGGEATVTATAAAVFLTEGRFTVTRADGSTVTATPSPTPIVTPSPTPVVTPSPTPTITPSSTPTVTPTPVPTVTPSPTPVVTPTPIIIYVPVTVTPMPSPTPTPAPAVSPQVSVTDEPVPTAAPTATPTPAVSIGTMTFKDVSPQAWFYSDLRASVRMGLLNGISKTEFDPSGELTLAQAVTLTARIHQLHENDEITLKNHWFGPKWYKTYVKYAVENNLVDESFKKLSRREMTASITRGELIELLYKALPKDEYQVINDIADNEIPDVKDFSDGAEAIYAMYRAGILTGYTDTPGVKEHTLKGHESVTRSEAAVIAARMTDSTRRVQFTIAK